ncbi:hypothetical protein FOZ62_008266, partial [Perkinsus olseni]
GKYRGLKHRPHWAVVDRAMYDGVLDRGHLGLDPGQRPSRDAVASHEHLFQTTSGSGGFSKQKAARLDDFVTDSIALRFAIDWLQDCIDQSSEALEMVNRRKAKAQLEVVSAAHASRGRKGKAEAQHQDSSFIWSDDGELRGVMGVTTKLLDIVCSSSASPLLHGACVGGHLLVAVWKGIEPMLSTLTQRYVNNVTLGSGQHCLPPPALHFGDPARVSSEGELPNGYHSRGYHWIA